MRSKYGTTLLTIALLFLVIALVVGKVYDIGLHRPPLKYANIPDVTKEYLRSLDRNNRDQGITVSDVGPFDWDNNTDLGQDKHTLNPLDKDQDQVRSGWQQVENANFIVYYEFDEDALWQGRALDVLRVAQETIEPLKELFGVYFYPSTVNGRRLALYLPSTSGKYKETTCQLLEQPNYDITNVAGVTIIQVGPLGCLTRGIVLSPDVFEVPSDHINGFVKVLQHEMNHYVFFTAVNYNNDVHHYLWISEGIAEYFCRRHNGHQVRASDSINFISTNCDLNGEFTMEASYWAGESFFNFMEEYKGKNTVKRFLQNAYQCSTDSVFINMGMPAPQLHQEWIEALELPAVDSLDFENSLGNSFS